MLRLLLALFAAFAIAAFGACSTSSPTATTAAAPMSFNDKVALAEQLVQTVQTSATAALRAGRINVLDDQRVQASVGALHNALVSAKALQASDPAGAGAAIDKAIADLQNLKASVPVAPSPPANTPSTSKVPS